MHLASLCICAVVFNFFLSLSLVPHILLCLCSCLLPGPPNLVNFLYSHFAFGLNSRSSFLWYSLGHALHSPSGSLHSWLTWFDLAESLDPTGLSAYPIGISPLGLLSKTLPSMMMTDAFLLPLFSTRVKSTILNEQYKTYVMPFFSILWHFPQEVPLLQTLQLTLWDPM